VTHYCTENTEIISAGWFAAMSFIAGSVDVLFEVVQVLQWRGQQYQGQAIDRCTERMFGMPSMGLVWHVRFEETQWRGTLQCELLMPG
jgi:hypothetical protein